MMPCELVDVEVLHLDAANLRRHPQRNLAAIKASLSRFGQQSPIVIDANNVVRKGNGTLLVARELGWAKIAVVRSPLAGSEASAYAIADNRTAELATWDDVALGDVLGALKGEGFNLDEFGFNDQELEQLWETGADAILKGDHWPERTAPESHSIVVRYKEQDVMTLLGFLQTTDESILTTGKAGAKLLERIRQISPS